MGFEEDKGPMMKIDTTKGGKVKLPLAFHTEMAVREWLSKRVKHIFWVEPASGSSPGIPDAYVVERGKGIWLELKLGVVKTKKGTNQPERVAFTVRPEQRRLIRKFREEGIDCAFIVALSGTRDVLLVEANEETLRGTLTIKDNVRAHYLTNSPTGVFGIICNHIAFWNRSGAKKGRVRPKIIPVGESAAKSKR
jgi:hypothetical protein